jgi:hypothetical protein
MSNKVRSRLWLSGNPRCSGPTCDNHVEDTANAVYLVRRGITIAFCSPECHSNACKLYIDRNRADQEVKGKNLLRSMGYSPSSEEA